MAKILFLVNLAFVLVATLALYSKCGFDGYLIFKEVLFNLIFLWMVDILALIFFLYKAYEIGFVKFFRGYRKCSKCNELFHRSALQSIEIMVGVMDSESRYFCNSCAVAYLSRISRGDGPFSYMAREVSGRFSDNSL